MQNLIAQLFGVGAMIALFSIYQQSDRRRLLISKLCADALWVAHYFLLGAYGGMIPNLVGIFRECVFMQREKHKWANTPVIPVVFILINWGLGIRTFSSPINILPIAASTFVTISLWLKNVTLTKIICAPVSAAFLIYDIFVGSWIGVVNESIGLFSIALSAVRSRIKKAQKEN